jgi:kynurenine formamidase
LRCRRSFGKSWRFRLEEISRYDSHGPAWYWNDFSCGEHTGTHFDGPVHLGTGKDYARNATDTIPVEKFFAPACVIDVSGGAAADPDFLPTPQNACEGSGVTPPLKIVGASGSPCRVLALVSES